MKATELRIGNWVANLSDRNIIDKVSVLERGMIHLSSKEFADDERDLIGIPFTNPILNKIGLVKNNEFIIFKKGEEWNKFLFELTFEKQNVILAFQSGTCKILITYIHELQNLLFILLGKEILISDIDCNDNPIVYTQ